VSSDPFFLLFLEALSVILVVFICFFVVVDYLMKRFGFARYLSLKIGTNSKVFDSVDFLCRR
jgi:hypothetical protein